MNFDDEQFLAIRAVEDADAARSGNAFTGQKS
jgi:hypothetical protein